MDVLKASVSSFIRTKQLYISKLKKILNNPIFWLSHSIQILHFRITGMIRYSNMMPFKKCGLFEVVSI